MVAAVLLPNAKAAFVTSAGAPAVGYKLYTYDAGTLVPRTTYLDAAGVANNTNPIILDGRGEAVIYWNGSYKVILKDAADVPVWTADNVGFVLPGTATNDNAAAGTIGEYVAGTLAQGAAIALTTSVTVNVTSISLTAGDWDVSGVLAFTGNIATTVAFLVGSVSSVSAVHSAYGASGRVDFGASPAGSIATGIDIQTGLARFSLAATTTIFLVAQASFAVNTASVFGQIRARRVR